MRSCDVVDDVEYVGKCLLYGISYLYGLERDWLKYLCDNFISKNMFEHVFEELLLGIFS